MKGIRAYMFSSLRIPVWDAWTDAFRGNKAVLACAAVSTMATALFVCVPWTVAVVGAMIVLSLSAMENEPFLLIVIFLMPLRWLLQWDVPVREVFLVFRTLVIVGFFLGRLVRGQLGLRGLLRPSLTQASVLFLCVAVAPAILGRGVITHDTARSLLTLCTYIGFYFVILSWADSPQRVHKILLVLLYSTILTAGFAILQEIVGNYTSFWYFLNPPDDWTPPMDYRAPSFLGNCNVLAGYLNLFIPFSLGCFLLGKGQWKRLGAWTTGLGVVGVLCTQSIGGLVTLGGIVIFAILCFSRNWKKKLTLLAGICALAILFYFAKEILNPAHEQADAAYSPAARLVLWGIAFDLFVHSPILGVGWGNFLVLYGSYVSDVSWIPPGIYAAHNIYLQLLSETGIVGFAAFFLLIFRASRQAAHQLRSSLDTIDKALAFGVLGALLSVLLHGFVDFFFQVSAQYGTLFWVLLALLVVSGKRSGETVAGEQSVSRRVGVTNAAIASG